MKNPYFIGDDPSLTQTSGWIDAWTSLPSAYAVLAKCTEDLVAAVNFARDNRLRLVIKGGGHSYQGTSSAPDSLLIWTRAMNEIALHDRFVARGCEQKQGPEPAVSMQAGAIWMHAYAAVTTQGGRYVQGGGCTTVGVAGLVQGGGFGSFSKKYGLAAAALLEAEVVTADGETRLANACTHPDLFWALKGGGGGSLGVVTRVTLRTRELPATVGGVFGTIRAASDAAFRRLIATLLGLYRDQLFNPQWGEQIVFESGNRVRIAMVFQGLDRQQAQSVWQPFLNALARAPEDYSLEAKVHFIDVPARHFWDLEYLRANFPAFVVADDRAGAKAGSFSWIGDVKEAGQELHGYRSAWLPASLLAGDLRSLVDALFRTTRHWGVSLHFNKGLAGAPAEELAAARNTAMNPAVLDAFALAIVAGGGPVAPNRGGEAALSNGRRNAKQIRRAMDELLKVVPKAGSYVAESDFFQDAWTEAFWGPNHARLAAVKDKYDPDGLFFVHHGVGSEAWSADGFTRSPRG